MMFISSSKDARINNQDLRFLPYLACLSSGLFSFYSLLQLSLFNVISPYIIDSFQLTHVQMGLFSAIFILANTLWLLPGGWLLDKYSARPIALIFILLNALTNFVFALSHDVILSIAMRAIQGTASAISLLTYVRIAPYWFPHKPATALGFVSICAALGGVFGNTIFAKWVIIFGWRYALALNGVIGIIFFVIIWFGLHEKNHKMKLGAKQKLTINDIKAIISNFQNTFYGLYIGFMALPVFLLASLWGVLYLTHTWQLSPNAASQICALIFVGGLLGEPCFGFISDQLQNRKNVMLFGALLALICMLVLLLSKSLTSFWLALLFFAIGFLSSTQMLCYISIRKVNPVNKISIATSYACLLMNIIGIFYQFTSGFIIAMSKKSFDYQYVIIAIAISFAVCFLLGLFIQDQKNNVNNR